MPTLSQDVRNTVYAVVAALTGLATALGFLDQQQVIDLNVIVTSALDLVAGVLGLAALVLAWWNSLVSRTVTLPLVAGEGETIGHVES